MFFISGIRRSREANVQAPRAAKQRPENAADDAAEVIAPPFIITGRNTQISILAVSSMIPAPGTKPDLQILESRIILLSF